MTAATITDVEFEYVRTLVRDKAAIVLEPGKAYLVESRLAPIARQIGVESVRELVGRLRREPYGKLHHQVVEAMTTNETSFLRDSTPYDALRANIVPELLSRKGADTSLTIWSAACSSGQEPYSIAMVLKEHVPQLAGWNVRIMASDFSEEMVERARKGAYSQLEVNRGLPAPLLVKHFRKSGAYWQVNEDLRKMVQFGIVNLAANWPALPMFDVVFLRNVMIYFDLETKRQILAKVRKVLRPGGYLLLGNAETTLNIDEVFQRVQFGKASCYQLPR